MTIIGPLLPANIHLLCQKAVLRQLQSCLRGELSIMAPAVGDDCLVLGQGPKQGVQLIHGRAESAGYVPARKRLPAPGIQQNEIELEPALTEGEIAPRNTAPWH